MTSILQGPDDRNAREGNALILACYFKGFTSSGLRFVFKT